MRSHQMTFAETRLNYSDEGIVTSTMNVDFKAQKKSEGNATVKQTSLSNRAPNTQPDQSELHPNACHLCNDQKL